MLPEWGLVASVPGGALKVPCCGAGSSQRAGFHLNFVPEKRSQRLSPGLGWEMAPAKTTDTAGHFAPPLVTHTDRPDAISPTPVIDVALTITFLN